MTSTLPWLRSIGCFSEIHQYQLRVFVPSGDPVQAERIIAAIGLPGGETAQALAAE